MIDIFHLDLPKPSEKIISLAKDYIGKVKLDFHPKEWLDNFYNNSVNSALHEFKGNADLTKLIQNEYQNYFGNLTLFSGYGVIKNANGLSACLPPHIDRGRSLAVNYYIDLGGDQVSTVFYDLVSQINPAGAQNFRYEELKKLESVIFKQDRWYAYDVCRCHSVENVNKERFFIFVAVNSTQIPRESYNTKNLVNDCSKRISFSSIKGVNG